MMKLEKEISKKSKIIKCMNMKEFYQFHMFLKEIMPVMSMLSENYESKIDGSGQIYAPQTLGGVDQLEASVKKPLEVFLGIVEEEMKEVEVESDINI